MTRKSRREIERVVDDLVSDEDGGDEIQIVKESEGGGYVVAATGEPVDVDEDELIEVESNFSETST